MVTILIAYKVESSEKDPRQMWANPQSVLICSDVPKGTHYTKFKVFILVIDLSESYMLYTLQIQQGHYWGFQFFILPLSSNKGSAYFNLNGKNFSYIFGTK